MNAVQSVALALCLLACLVGCARIKPHARTTEEVRVHMVPGDYERLAYVEGRDCAARYLSLFRLSTPNLVTAIEQAKGRAAGANFLVNQHVAIVEEFVVPLVYHRLCVVVEGRAIKLHTAAEEGS